MVTFSDQHSETYVLKLFKQNWLQQSKVLIYSPNVTSTYRHPHMYDIEILSNKKIRKCLKKETNKFPANSVLIKSKKLNR